MTALKRISILIFLHSRNELSSGGRKELMAWRLKDPEHEKLFFELTDPESLRAEMKVYYKERDRAFEKLKIRMPELEGASLSGTNEEAVRVFSEVSEDQAANSDDRTQNEISKSGPSPVEYWGSMISNLGEESADDHLKAVKHPVFVKINLGWLKKRWQRRIVRTVISVAATWLCLVVLKHLPGKPAENSEAVIINTDGLRIIGKGWTSGSLAAEAGVSTGHTERDELIYFVTDEPKAKQDKYYPVITDPIREHLILFPDGTRAWMNATSTLRYPANFGRDTIKLELDGEVFIEVSKNSPHHYQISRFPYSVNTAKGKDAEANPVYENVAYSKRALVHALPGTRLNFSTYPGHHETLVTMISGPAAQLDSAGDGRTAILSGQQASIIKDQLTATQIIDTSEVIAWARGEFHFKNAPIQTIARELEPWYDISVEFKGQIPDEGFTLQVPRTTDIEEVLDILKKQGLAIFIHGKTVNIHFK